MDIMKIAFLGDSITEGIPGASYVEGIRKNKADFELVNFGKGGDTAGSLLKRIKKINDLDSFDVFVLFIGINDIYGKLTFQYKILKLLMGQKAASNYLVFKEKYKKLLDYVKEYKKKLIVIPPLLLGEDLTTQWNHQVLELVNIIENLVLNDPSVIYLNARNRFVDELSTRNASGYLPLSILELNKDIKTLKNVKSVDLKSIDRGLLLTLDGVHLNSKGAEIISSMIIEELKK